MNRFQDKVVIVTGGSSGIGRATSIAFAHEGAKVVVADIDEKRGTETADLIRSRGGTATFSAVDMANAASVAALVESTVSTHGRLDVVFSNAGVLDAMAPCVQTTDEVWNRVIGVNLAGCFYISRAALPHLAKTKGNIVFTSSIAGLGGLAGGTAYTASKHGVSGLVNQLGCEFAAYGVRVNAVAPGGVRTNMIEEAGVVVNAEEFIKSMTPLGRVAEPEEIARPVLFLASSDASYITGTTLRVDGGWRSK
jgi:NAD(P)-dependent dehydrogenase (short-subunit alcohol dehydrogenase family)